MDLIAKGNEVHICDSCAHETDSCKAEYDGMIFGTGKGGDNVAACKEYCPIELRHPKHSGCGDI